MILSKLKKKNSCVVGYKGPNVGVVKSVVEKTSTIVDKGIDVGVIHGFAQKTLCVTDKLKLPRLKLKKHVVNEVHVVTYVVDIVVKKGATVGNTLAAVEKKYCGKS